MWHTAHTSKIILFLILLYFLLASTSNTSNSRLYIWFWYNDGIYILNFKDIINRIFIYATFVLIFGKILSNTPCVCLNEWRNYKFDNEVKWRDSELMKLMIDFCSGIKVNLALMPNIYIEKLIKATAPDQNPTKNIKKIN